VTWWQAFPLDKFDVGKSWQLKLQYLRKKFRGRNNNYKGLKKKEKKTYLENLNKLEMLQELRELTKDKFLNWIDNTNKLDQIYNEEDLY
jgi:hypothetical protein